MWRMQQDQPRAAPPCQDQGSCRAQQSIRTPGTAQKMARGSSQSVPDSHSWDGHGHNSQLRSHQSPHSAHAAASPPLAGTKLCPKAVLGAAAGPGHPAGAGALSPAWGAPAAGQEPNLPGRSLSPTGLGYHRDTRTNPLLLDSLQAAVQR